MKRSWDRNVHGWNFESEIDFSGSRLNRPFCLLKRKLTNLCLRKRKEAITNVTQNTLSLLTHRNNSICYRGVLSEMALTTKWKKFRTVCLKEYLLLILRKFLLSENFKSQLFILSIEIISTKRWTFRKLISILQHWNWLRQICLDT